MSVARRLGVGGLFLVGLGACDAIVGAGGRRLDPSISCTDKGCECAVGFGDCDGDVDNGCETRLDDPQSCGACGNVCDNGRCEDLACACEGTFGDCDGDPKTVCETDLSSSSEHCGTCERSCLTGKCKDGLCQLEILPNTASVYGFAVKDGWLYFTSVSEPGLFREPLDGMTAPETFGTSVDRGKIVKVSGDTLYWMTDSEILATPIAGGPTVALSKGTQPLYQLTVGGGKVYWDDVDDMDAMQSMLMRVPIEGGQMPESVTLLGETKYLHDFIASDKHVYFNDTKQIRRVEHGATTPLDFVATITSATLYGADGATLYFAGQTSGMFGVSFMGGTPEKLADAAPGYGMVVPDGDRLYFLTSIADKDPNQSVWRVGKEGGEATKLAVDPAMYSGQPMSVDDKWVYWLTLSGVARVAK